MALTTKFLLTNVNVEDNDEVPVETDELGKIFKFLNNYFREKEHADHVLKLTEKHVSRSR